MRSVGVVDQIVARVAYAAGSSANYLEDSAVVDNIVAGSIVKVLIARAVKAVNAHSVLVGNIRGNTAGAVTTDWVIL